MKKAILLSVLPLSIACGGDSSTVSPALDALTLTAPLFAGQDPSCAMDGSATMAIDEWLVPVQTRLGAPSGLLDELDASPVVSREPLIDRFRVEVGSQALELVRRDRVSTIEMEFTYEEPTTAGRFVWAVGTMLPDESSGSWTVYDWNAHPRDLIQWESRGGAIEATHELTGSSRTARVVRSLSAERVSMQDPEASAVLAEWDFNQNAGFVEIDGARSCLAESSSSASVCQRVCDDGR